MAESTATGFNIERRKWLAAKRLLDSLPMREPLQAKNLGELQQFLRYSIGVDQRDPYWNSANFGRLGLAEDIIKVMEDTKSGRANPLNVVYLFHLEKAANYLFAHHAKPPTAAQKEVERHFWTLAWDYANATEAAWKSSTIRVRSCRKVLGFEAEELPKKIYNCKAGIARGVMQYDATLLAWNPQQSAYADFLGDLSRKRVTVQHNPIAVDRPDIGFTRYDPTKNWGRKLTPERQAALNQARSQSHAYRQFQAEDLRDPLKIKTLGKLNRYIRLALGAEGISGWSQDSFERFSVSRTTLDAVEREYTIGPSGRKYSPLNLTYLEHIPDIAEELFTLDSKPAWLNSRFEQYFWHLAWDYANAVETAWITGDIRESHVPGKSCRGYANVRADIASIKEKIASHLKTGELDIPWRAEESPYVKFLGNLNRIHDRVRHVIDHRLTPPETLAQAEFFGDYIWHLVDRYQCRGAITERLGISNQTLNGFFSRFTGASGEEADAANLAEMAGYSEPILRHLPALFGYLKEQIPADVFTPYEQARFWCLAEDYVYAGLDCAYERGGKAIRGVNRFREVANEVVDQMIPQAMAELAQEHPLQAAKAALAMDNSLMLSLASGEVRKRRRSGEMTDGHIVEALPGIRKYMDHAGGSLAQAANDMFGPQHAIRRG